MSAAATVHRVQLVHVLGNGRAGVLRETREVAGRYASVPARGCPDCATERPATVPPGEGYDAAIMIIHAATCPRLSAALRQGGGS